MPEQVVVAKADGDFAAIVTDTVNARDAAQAAESGAVSAKNAAETAESNAAASETTTQGYRNETQTLRNETQAFRSEARNSVSRINDLEARQAAGPPKNRLYLDAGYLENEGIAFDNAADALAQCRGLIDGGAPQVFLEVGVQSDGTPYDLKAGDPVAFFNEYVAGYTEEADDSLITIVNSTDDPVNLKGYKEVVIRVVGNGTSSSPTTVEVVQNETGEGITASRDGVGDYRFQFDNGVPGSNFVALSNNPAHLPLAGSFTGQIAYTFTTTDVNGDNGGIELNITDFNGDPQELKNDGVLNADLFITYRAYP